MTAVDRLDDDAIAEGVAHLEWDREGDKLVKTVTRDDFAGAMQFVNAVAEMAESVNHHPDIHISWNKVSLELTSHSAGGLTQADLDLAGAIDGLA